MNYSNSYQFFKTFFFLLTQFLSCGSYWSLNTVNFNCSRFKLEKCKKLQKLWCLQRTHFNLKDTRLSTFNKIYYLDTYGPFPKGLIAKKPNYNYRLVVQALVTVAFGLDQIHISFSLSASDAKVDEIHLKCSWHMTFIHKRMDIKSQWHWPFFLWPVHP